MPIPLPNLDDRSYNDLVAEALTLIPSIYPAWTNYNPSDPGITLVELLAWLTEMALYRLDDVSNASIVTFLKLLDQDATSWILPDERALAASQAALDQQIHATVLKLRDRYRAVTADDYEYLALVGWAQDARQAGGVPPAPILRARCIPGRILQTGASGRIDAPGHVSLVVVSDAPADRPTAAPEVCDALWQFLDRRRLLAARHHVVGPSYVPISIGARLYMREDAQPGPTLRLARDALATFFHPLVGGADGAGWPFGRAVYASEIYAALQRLALVDHVADVTLVAPGPIDNATLALPADFERTQSGRDGPIGINLFDNELPTVELSGLLSIDYRGNVYYLKDDLAVKVEARGGGG
jgi:hypothetical protein